MQSENLNAAIVIIGNEILSGKTQDVNLQFIAKELGDLGIRLKEVRIIPDFEQDIISTVNELRQKYTYIFTTGGIGPTHDDITAPSIAKAFNVQHKLDQKAKKLIENHLIKCKKPVRPDHIKMAYIPQSAELLLNDETGAPGFKIENVFVMAGVPYIMQSIFKEAKKHLKKSKPIISKSIELFISEGLIAEDFGVLQQKYPKIEMGSYPFKDNEKWGTSLVLRGDNPEMLNQAKKELLEILSKYV